MEAGVSVGSGGKVEMETSGGTVEKQEGKIELSFDQIAEKLLEENLLLTALELYTEVVESGREIGRLRDYFSNPGNFERPTASKESPVGLSENYMFYICYSALPLTSMYVSLLNAFNFLLL